MKGKSRRSTGSRQQSTDWKMQSESTFAPTFEHCSEIKQEEIENELDGIPFEEIFFNQIEKPCESKHAERKKGPSFRKV